MPLALMVFRIILTKQTPNQEREGCLARKRGGTDMNIFYIIGVIVVVLFIAGYFGLR